MRRRWASLHVLQDDAVRFYRQPIAVVVARSLVQAEHPALRQRPRHCRATSVLGQ